MEAAEDAYAEAERRIAAWRQGEALDLAIVGLETIPGGIRALTKLQSLDCSFTSVSDLSPLSGLTALQSLDCSRTQVSDLSPLSGLTALRSLTCSGTSVSDLSPLSGLTALQSLTCSGTSVSDLSPLSGLTALQSLHCFGTEVSDLSPLSGLTALQSLDCSGTSVSGLSPLSSLTALQSLDCSGTSVSDLSPLSGLTALQLLDCSGTSVSDLSPLSGLTALESLHCSGSLVSDLSPLSGLTALESLGCAFTSVCDLLPLDALPALQRAEFSRCRLDRAPISMWWKASLRNLRLWETMIPDIPAEVLSQTPVKNCLASLRAHLSDLGDQPEPARQAKLFILGNGRVGKTQIARRLRHEDYDPRITSTHGILVSDAPVPGGGDGRLNLWDFGGQDLYHSTHALFLRSRSVFLVVWSEAMEAAQTHEHEGLEFRNYPLTYWLDYVRRLGGADAPVIVVQAQCDTPAVERVLPPAVWESLERFTFRKVLQYSAQENRGRAALDEAIAEAFVQLDQPLIGSGRAAILRNIDGWRAQLSGDAAAAVPKTLSQDDFRTLCETTGGISDADQFLRFLHNAGAVFHQPGLFGDQIIIDQNWVLQAIYAVFHRQSCTPVLRDQGGRFTRFLLAALLWERAPNAYTVKEQRLFLSMMQTCGICFSIRDSGAADSEYVAPDLLPDKRPDTEIAARWDRAAPIERATLRFDLLPQTLMRGVICRIGGRAGLSGLYWLAGLCVYEARTGSRALVEQAMDGDWCGRITLATQGGRAPDLLRALVDIVVEEAARFGLDYKLDDEPVRRRLDEAPDMPALEFRSDPTDRPDYYVSYAWKDDKSPEGRRREDEVDRFCSESEARNGIRVHRDKDDLGFRDSIGRFMERLGQGERVFVFLSDKYLKSPNCMFELSEVWRHAGQREDDFVARIRVFALSDARIKTIPDRMAYAAHWTAEFEKLDAAVRHFGPKHLSVKDAATYLKIGQFADAVRDILTVIADRVQPRSFDDFFRDGFD